MVRASRMNPPVSAPTLVLQCGSAPLASNTRKMCIRDRIKWCAYFGDVSAIRFLLANGESLASLAGELTIAAFHGHWQLCQFLIENGAHVNQAEDETGETPLHSALCKSSASHDRVVRVLLALSLIHI